MQIIQEVAVQDFEAWAGGVDTLQTIIDNNMAVEFEQLIEELYPDGVTETQVNDILWHESEYVYDVLGIEEEL